MLRLFPGVLLLCCRDLASPWGVQVRLLSADMAPGIPSRVGPCPPFLSIGHKVSVLRGMEEEATGARVERAQENKPDYMTLGEVLSAV